MTDSQPDRLLGIPEAAERLGVSESVVRTWLRSGRLRSTILADEYGWRITAAAVQQLLASRARDGGAPDAR